MKKKLKDAYLIEIRYVCPKAFVRVIYVNMGTQESGEKTSEDYKTARRRLRVYRSRVLQVDLKSYKPL